MLRGRFKNFAIFRMHGAGDQHFIALGDAHSHHGGFRNGGGAIIHRSVGDIHARQLAHHGLEFEDADESALRDFGLIRSVGGEKLTARDNGVDDHRAVVVIDSGAEKTRIAIGVAGRLLLEIIDNFELTHAVFEVEAFVKTNVGREDGRLSLLRSGADGGQHFTALRV